MSTQNKQLVVAVKPTVGLRVGLDPSVPPRMAVGDIGPLIGLLRKENITLRPLFGHSEDRLRARMPLLPGNPEEPHRDLSSFYVVDLPAVTTERLDQLAQQFRREDYVA